MGLRTQYKHEDFEHKKIKEIEEELDRINDKFRDLGFFWMLKKKEKFETAEEVEPPKDTFETEDEDEIRNDLDLRAKRRRYILHKEKLRLEEEGLLKKQRELLEGAESSESESESEAEEVKERKEIIEIWYLRIEKNF